MGAARYSIGRAMKAALNLGFTVTALFVLLITCPETPTHADIVAYPPPLDPVREARLDALAEVSSFQVLLLTGGVVIVLEAVFIAGLFFTRRRARAESSGSGPESEQEA
jgi:hypothetical protein